jgi:hypothetical protein
LLSSGFPQARIRQTAHLEVPAFPPRYPPGWAKRWFPGTPRGRWGLELFAGSCRLTSAFRALGLPVLTPVEISMGFDVMSDLVEQLILTNEKGWIWSGPPCCSFIPLRNLDKYGPLRPKGHPVGDSSKFEVWLGSRLWLRSLYLVKLAWTKGAFVCIEHPMNLKAGQLQWTQSFVRETCATFSQVDWCMFGGHNCVELPIRKPTRLLTNAPWIVSVVKTCDDTHEHGPMLRGARTKAAAAYPQQFCDQIASSYFQWGTTNPLRQDISEKGVRVAGCASDFARKLTP